MYIPIPITISIIACITLFVTFGTNIIARKIYQNDSHHSGMDIKQTKEK